MALTIASSSHDQWGSVLPSNDCSGVKVIESRSFAEPINLDASLLVTRERECAAMVEERAKSHFIASERCNGGGGAHTNLLRRVKPITLLRGAWARAWHGAPFILLGRAPPPSG